MGQARFIGKRSRASGNSSGLRLEKTKSVDFHSTGIPLLISPDLLRKRDLGQLDLVRMTKKASWTIEVAEVKSSDVGLASLERGQRRRIIGAMNFLSRIFGYPSRFIPTK